LYGTGNGGDFVPSAASPPESVLRYNVYLPTQENRTAN
jgi:hypothetical protein